jgi:hypothetical protein
MEFKFEHTNIFNNIVYTQDKSRVSTDGSSTKCTVLPTDKDPFKQGLHPRTEIRPRVQLPLEFILQAEFIVSAPNITFLQIMGRDELKRGKPLIVLDTHNDMLHVRVNNFNNAMIRHFMFKPDYSKPIQVEMSGSINKTNGMWKVRLTNGDSFKEYVQTGKPTYFKHQHDIDAIVSVGVYATGPRKQAVHTTIKSLSFSQIHSDIYYIQLMDRIHKAVEPIIDKFINEIPLIHRDAFTRKLRKNDWFDGFI